MTSVGGVSGMRTLALVFLSAMKLYSKVNEDAASTVEIDLCTEELGMLVELVRREDLFSTGEQLDDWTTGSLKYYPVDFYLAHVLCKWPEMAQRAQKLQLAKLGMLAFLQRCVDGEFPYDKVNLKDYIAAMEEGRGVSLVGTDGASIREAKIAAYKEEKARKVRIMHLISYMATLEEDGDLGDTIDTEDEKRELYILQIQSCIAKAMSEMAMMKTELELLKHRSDMEDEGGPGALERFQQEPLPSKPIEVTRMNKVDGELFMEREVVQDNVFRPRMQAPTMTLEEFAMEELDKIAEQDKRKAEAGPDSGGPRRYEHLLRDGDEDDADLVEQATYQDREWDAFKEENKKGSGNRHGKKF